MTSPHLEMFYISSNTALYLITWLFLYSRHAHSKPTPGVAMADTGGKGDGGGGDHSSGEYSGVVDQASVGMSGKAQDMAAVISSGRAARAKREANRRQREEEEAEERRQEEEKATKA